MEIKNKNVFVTGSTRGIGLAIAHHFAELGANIILNGRSTITDDVIGQFDSYDVKVIAISGQTDLGELELAKHCGYYGYVGGFEEEEEVEKEEIQKEIKFEGDECP